LVNYPNTIYLPGNTYHTGDAVVYQPGPGSAPLIDENTATSLVAGRTYYVTLPRPNGLGDASGLIMLAPTYEDAVGTNLPATLIRVEAPMGVAHLDDTPSFLPTPTINLPGHGFSNGTAVTYRAPAPSLFQNQAIGAAAPPPGGFSLGASGNSYAIYLPGNTYKAGHPVIHQPAPRSQPRSGTRTN